MLIEAKDISSTCKEIMNDPLIKIATTKKKRDRAVNEAKRDGMAPQEILFNNRRTSGEIYLNMKERITIELFKSLFTLIGNPANEETMNALQQTGQLTEERDEKSKEPTYKISMNP